MRKSGFSLQWALVFVVGLAFLGYEYEHSAPVVRAKLEAKLSSIEAQRHQIALDRIQRAAEDASFRNRARNLTADDKGLLDEGEALMREIEGALLQALDDSERATRKKLAEATGR